MTDDKFDISNQALADILQNAVDAELDKPENEQDLDFVAECVDIINHINRTSVEVTGDEIEGKIREIYLKVNSGKNTGKIKRSRFCIIKRVLAAACVALLILITPVAVMAAVQSRSPVDILKEFGMTIFDLPYNEQVEVNGITFQRISPDNISEYDDIESLIQNEGLDILYPSWLPEGVEVTAVKISVVDDSEWIIFRFSDESVVYSVLQNANSAFETNSFALNSVSIIYYHDDCYYYAQFEYNGYSYSLGSKTQTLLEKIINGIKGSVK